MQHSIFDLPFGSCWDFIYGDIEAPAKISEADRPNPNTPLHVATLVGSFEDVMTLLIKSNTEDVNAKNSHGKTPLHLAVKTNHTRVVETLLIHGANIHAKDRNKMTPFQLAVRMKLTDIVKAMVIFAESVQRCGNTCQGATQDVGSDQLIEFTKTIHTPRILRRFDAHRNRSVDNLVMVSEKVLTAWDITIDRMLTRSAQAMPCGFGFRPPSGAQKYEVKPGDVQYHIDPVDREEMMPMTVTVRKNEEPLKILRRECFKAILGALRADVTLLKTLLSTNIIDGHETTEDGYTALHVAVKTMGTSEKVVEILLNSGKYNVNAFSPKSETPIFFAIDRHKVGLLLLLNHKADINLRNWRGETVLIRAAECNCYHNIKLLTDWAKDTGIVIDLDARDFFGETALLKAARMRYPETVRVLMEAGASVDVADYCGHTVLHKALYEVLTPDDCINIRSIWKELFNGDLNISLQAIPDEKLQQSLNEYLHPEDREYFVYLWKELVSGRRHDYPEIEVEELRNRDIIQGMFGDNSPETEKEARKRRTVNILLENGNIDINAIDIRGNTPLDMALNSGLKTRACTIEKLKQRGATFRPSQSDEELKRRECVIDKSGGSPFHRLAVAQKYRPIGPSYGYKCDQFYSILVGILWFSQLQKDKCRRIVEIKDKQGRTALHKALLQTSFSCDWLPDKDMVPLIHIAQVLLELGCSIDATDNYGRTPLHYALGPYADILIKHDRVKNVKDVDRNSAKDVYGKSAIEMIEIRRQEEETTRKYDDRGATQYIKDQVVRISDITELLEIDSSLVESMHFRYGTFPHFYNEKSVYATDLLSTIMNKANFAHCHPISALLNKEVNEFVNRIANEIRRYDSRFECKPIFVGSSFEETKLDFPDEYDFDLVLTKFSEHCEVLPSPVLPTGFVHLKKKQVKDDDSLTNHDFDNFFNSDGILLTNKVNMQFKLFLGEVLEDPMFLENEHIFEINWRCENDANDHWSNGVNQNGLCTNLRLTLNRPLDGHYMFKEISIDIVPCIHIDNWWPEGALQDIKEDLKIDGCNLVFDQPHRKYPWIPYTDPCVRISFAPIESRLIRDSCKIAKTAYMVGKQLIKNSKRHTYILKTCLLHCNEVLDPLHEKRTGRRYKGMSSVSLLQLFDLHIWVTKLLKCYLDFNLQDFCPCYMMPSFILPIDEYLKSNHIKLLFCEDALERRTIYTEYYESIYHLYHSIASSETDLSLELPKPEPLVERFDREQLLEKLASPMYPCKYEMMRLLHKCPLYPKIERNIERGNKAKTDDKVDEEEDHDEDDEEVRSPTNRLLLQLL